MRKHRMADVIAGTTFLIGFVSLWGSVGWAEYMDEIGSSYPFSVVVVRVAVSLAVMIVPTMLLGRRHDR